MSKSVIKTAGIALAASVIIAIAIILSNLFVAKVDIANKDSQAIISRTDTNASAPSGTTEVQNLSYDGSTYKYNAGIYYSSASLYDNRGLYFKPSSAGEVTFTYFVTHTSMGTARYWCSLTFGLYDSADKEIGSSNIWIESDHGYHNAGHNSSLTIDASKLKSGETYTLKTQGTFERYTTSYKQSWNNEKKMIYDIQAPVIRQSEGYYTNSRQIIGFEDNITGIDKIAVKAPGKSDYEIRLYGSLESEYDAQFTIGNDGEGEYSYYAVDKLGNKSETKKKFYDATRPLISCAVANRGSTSTKATVNASDAASGIDKFYYSSPETKRLQEEEKDKPDEQKHTLNGFVAVSGNSFVIGDEGEGMYEFYAVDRAGNTSLTYTLYYDTIAPVLRAAVATDGYANSKLSISISDEVSGVAKIYYKAPEDSEFKDKAGSTYVIGGEGEGWYQVYAEDKAGNRSEIYKLYYDVTLPTLTCAVAKDSYTNTKAVLSGADAGSGFATLHYKTPSDSKFQSQTSARYTIGGNGDGWYEVYIKDKAGNQSATYMIYYDITKPVISSATKSGGYTNAKAVMNATDAGSGVATLHFKIPGGSAYSLQSSAAYAIGGAGEGWYEAYAVDRAGNRSATYKLYYDVTLPTLTCAVAKDSYTNTKAVLSGADVGSGFATLYYKTPSESGFSSQTEAKFMIGGNGDGWYEAYIKDKAGNQSATYKIYYDITKPTVSSAVATGKYTNTKAVMNAADAGSGVARLYYKTPAASAYKSQSAAAYSIGGAGEGWYEVYAVDRAGNQSAAYKINYDITKPVLGSAVASGGYTAEKAGISASDGASGVAKLHFKTPVSGSYIAQTSPSYSIGSARDGWYEVYATDNAGNVSDTYRIFYDITAPNIAIRNADENAVPDLGYANSGVYFTMSDNTSINTSVLYMYVGGVWKVIKDNLHTQSVHTDTTVYYDNRAAEKDRVYYASRQAALAAIYDVLDDGIKEYSGYTASDADGCTIPGEQLDIVQSGAVYYKFSYDGVTYVYFSLDALKSYIASIASSRIASSSKQLYSNGDGDYKIEVIDICGNKSVKTFSVDTTPPQADILGYVRTYNMTPIISGAHTLKLNASDVNLNKYVINGYEVIIGAGELIDYILPKDKFVEGKNVLTLYDKAGNSELIYYYYDTAAPIIKVSHNGKELRQGDYFSGKVAELNIEVTESFFFNLKAGDMKISSKTASVNVGGWRDGELIIESEDYAGNKGVIALNIDNTAPKLIWSGHNRAVGLNVYANGKVSVSAEDRLYYTLYYKRLSDGGYKELSLDISDINTTYNVYAVDSVGNIGDTYTLLISVIDDFGNESKINAAYKVNSFYTVNLPAKVFAVETKKNIAGRYSFLNREDALAWAISKEYEYRVTETGGGWLYVSPSKESVIQLYTDKSSLMSVVTKYAQQYVDGERTVVNSANAQYYTMMSGEGKEDVNAFIAQDINLPDYLSRYKDYNAYQIRADYIYKAPTLSYGQFAGGVRYTLIGNDYATDSGVAYELKYGQSLADAAGEDGLQQGYYLVREYDYCGNGQSYIAYIDTQAPVLTAVARYGNGSESTVMLDTEYIEAQKSGMYYISLDLASVTDNIDGYYIVSVESNKGYSKTFIQGDELPIISADDTGSGVWSVKIQDRSGNVLSFSFFIADAEPNWTYTSLSSLKSMTMRFNVSESYNAITHLEIYRVMSDGTTVRQDKDSNGTDINAMTLSYTFDVGGKLSAMVKDLFGRTVEFGPIFYLKGLPTGSLGGVIDGGVTNGDVNFRYGDSSELIAYTFNGEEWIELDKTGYLSEYSATNSIWTATFEAGEARCDDFKLFLYNKADETLFVEYTFRIDNILAEFSILSEDGKSIEPNGSTNKPFYITWEESSVRITNSTTGALSSTYKKGAMITSDGVYNFTIRDYAGNTLTFTVLLDTKVSYKVEGEFKLIDGVYYSAKPLTLSVSEIFNEFTYISSNGMPVVNGSPITYDGSYYVRVVDYYGNVAEVSIVLDSVAPSYELSGVELGGSTSGKVMLTWDSLDAVQAWLVDKYNNIISDSVRAGDEYEAEGAYYVRLSDICGNTAIISFNIDKSVSYTANVANGQVITQKAEFKFEESVDVTVTKDGEEVKGLAFSEIGEYKLIATDKVNNAIEVNFCIIGGAYKEFSYTFPEGSIIVDAVRDGQAVEVEAGSGEICLNISGNYELTISSPHGHAYTLSVTVDNIAPTAEVVKGEDGNFTIENLSKEGITVQLYKNGEDIKYQLGDVISGNGSYTAVLTDALGNTSTYEFTIPYRLNTMSIVAIVIGVVAVMIIVAIIIVKRKIKS